MLHTVPTPTAHALSRDALKRVSTTVTAVLSTVTDRSFPRVCPTLVTVSGRSRSSYLLRRSIQWHSLSMLLRQTLRAMTSFTTISRTVKSSVTILKRSTLLREKWLIHIQNLLKQCQDLQEARTNLHPMTLQLSKYRLQQDAVCLLVQHFQHLRHQVHLQAQFQPVPFP